MYPRIPSRKIITSVFLFTVLSQLFINTLSARFVCLDAFGSNVYLFGDIHSIPYGDNHSTGYEDIEQTQITNILNNLKTKNEPICILTEDLFALHGKTLNKKALNSLRFGTIRGLTQRINSINKPNIQAISIEKRFHIYKAITFFDPMREISFNGGHAPEKIKMGKYLNDYTLTFAHLCNEIQGYKNELQTICTTSSFNATIKGIITANLAQIDAQYEQLTDFLKQNNIKQSDIMLEKAIELHLNDIQKTFDPSPEFEKLFPQLKEAFTTFASTYPNNQDKQSWKVQTLRIRKLMHAINQCPQTKPTIESRTPVHQSLMNIGILIVDTYAFIDILKNMAQKTVALFAGFLHTQNIKNMLIKAGLEYNQKASIPYSSNWPFAPALSHEELMFPKEAQPLIEHISNDDTVPIKTHINNGYSTSMQSRLRNLLNKLINIPVITALGALGTYLLLRDNTTNSIAETIIGALFATTAGGLTCAKIYNSYFKRFA